MRSFPLEPIDKARQEEVQPLKLKRLKATLEHEYENSPVSRVKLDAAGVHQKN